MLPESYNFKQTSPAQLRDNIDASSPISLIQVGWTFAAEPTTDSGWRVIGSKGELQIAATASRLGEAFQNVEMEARQREASLALAS